MAVRNLEAVQQLSGSAVRAESRPGRIGPISLGAKQTGERRAGNPHAAFDVAGIGNVAWSRCCDTRRRKGETTGNTNIDLNRRASPRSYRWIASVVTPHATPTTAMTHIQQALNGNVMPSRQPAPSLRCTAAKERAAPSERTIPLARCRRLGDPRGRRAWFAARGHMRLPPVLSRLMPWTRRRIARKTP